MQGNNKLKEIDIKNCTCFYFNDIIKFEDFDLNNISIDERSSKNILVYTIYYKTLMHAKPLHIRFYKIERFIRVYGGTRFLLLSRD